MTKKLTPNNPISIVNVKVAENPPNKPAHQSFKLLSTCLFSLIAKHDYKKETPSRKDLTEAFRGFIAILGHDEILAFYHENGLEYPSLNQKEHPKLIKVFTEYLDNLPDTDFSKK